MIDQNSQFMAILTAVGEAKQANADALGIPWTFSKMGVGDANGTDPIPSRTQTKLINERNRAPLNQVKVDPKNTNVVIAEQVIPENVGGWWIREIGLYDADGDLVAVANCAPSFKPLLGQGSGKTQVVRMNFIVTSATNVTLKLDPSVVLATRAYVDGLTVRASQVEAEDGTENSKIMTPLRVFQAIAKVVGQATEAAFGWAKIATAMQIAAGKDDRTIVTPLKLKNAYGLGSSTFVTDLNAAPVGFFYSPGEADNNPGSGICIGETRTSDGTAAKMQWCMDVSNAAMYKRAFRGTTWTDWVSFVDSSTVASEAVPGISKIATQAQVTTGTDDATLITPKKLRSAQATQVEAEAGSDNSKVMTPLRVFQSIAKVVGQATETAFGWAKISTPVQVSTGTDDTTIITPKKLRSAQATQVEAEAGSDNSKIMTPLRVFQAIAKVVGQATETAFGWAKVSTPVQVATGTDDTTIITPKKLRGTQATQVEAEAGSDNSKIMTPLRVFQSIAKVVGQATEVTFGWAKVASQSLVDAGLDDAAFLTSKKLRTAYGVGSSEYLDNLDTANVGFYYSIAAAIGVPSGVTGILHGHTRGSDGTTTKIQTCTDVSSGKTYHRVLKGSAHPWSAWVELAVADGQLGNSSQSWQDLTSSRAINVNYTNSTGRPIIIAGRTASPAGVSGYVVVDGVNVVRLSLSSAQAVSDSWSVIVQPGSTYRTTGATSVQNWAELR